MFVKRQHVRKLVRQFDEFPWKLQDLNAWVHMQACQVPAIGSEEGKLHFHDSHRLAEQVSFQSDVLAKIDKSQPD